MEKTEVPNSSPTVANMEIQRLDLASSDVEKKQDGLETNPSSVSAPLTDRGNSNTPTLVHQHDAQKRWARWVLILIAFFMGDVGDGLGPFLGVYLQSRGWGPGLIGSVSTVSGAVVILVTGPIGAMIDATKYKRFLIAACTILIGVSQGCNLLSTHPAVVFLTQTVSAVAGTTMMPILIALTLGICSDHDHEHDRDGEHASVKKKRHSFRSLNGRNQAANHAGNMLMAGLASILGSRFGLTAVFWLVIAGCVATVGSVFLLPEKSINHGAARGNPEPTADGDLERNRSQDQARTPSPPKISKRRILKNRMANSALGSALTLLVKNQLLGIVGITIFLFHLGNAAILFLYGQAIVAAGEGDPAATTGLTVLIAQGTMIIMSFLTSWLAGRQGYWLSILLSYMALPIRAVIAGRYIKLWGIWPVQILDGIGAGIQGVAIPGLLAVMMDGTGRVNLAIGVVGGVTRSTGAAISQSLAGWIAQDRGYSFALYMEAIFPLVSLAIWIGFHKTLRPVMDRPKTEGRPERRGSES